VAETKVAMLGITAENIMKAADWSGEDVFQKFYYMISHSVEFVTSVLTMVVTASNSHVDMETF